MSDAPKSIRISQTIRAALDHNGQGEAVGPRLNQIAARYIDTIQRAKLPPLTAEQRAALADALAAHPRPQPSAAGALWLAVTEAMAHGLQERHGIDCMALAQMLHDLEPVQELRLLEETERAVAEIRAAA